VIPIVTPSEMAAIDAAAPEPVEVLIDRAGAAVARRAVAMLGGTYGRRVVVVAGKGNNGNDGRVAGRKLAARGVQVRVFEAGDAPEVLPPCDLVIDAAYGTGLQRPYRAPAPPDPATPVLAVDIASGIDGLTGEVRGRPVRAHQTVTFAALKPGLLLADGIDACGAIEVVDIGLDVSRARAHLVETPDVARWLPERDTHTHKWRSAVWVIGGSPGMTGAARLACGGAMRAGAGYVRLSVPGAHDAGAPTEVVQVPVSAALDDIDPADAARFAALVVGPGLGRAPATAEALAAFVARCDRPLVLDGDALTLLGEQAARVLAGRGAPTVLTPHDRELRELAGEAPGADRFAAVRALAGRTGSVVLLKGATTVVADPSGEVLVSTTGDARLATAGTGDVLAGCIGALLARGMPPFRAAAAGAHVHGLAARRASSEGMVAGDLLVHLPAVLSELRGRP
jgi:hydroxyethylthiazole kinase-like uncharacterized protein yjeF